MHPTRSPNPNSAFTLVELSIVLIIIGLIVGGILAGSNMIRAAELRSVISDVRKYQTITNVFKGKYGYLPGDLPNASDFWTDCVDDSTNLCNGDGNRRILRNSTTGTEALRAWQHLSLAELIDGSYTGLKLNANEGFYGGRNAPMSSLGNSYWVLHYDTTMPGTKAGGRHSHTLGGNMNSHFPWYSALTVEEAFSIDSKIDDSVGNSGKVWGINAWNASANGTDACTTDSNAGNLPPFGGQSDYLMENAISKNCRLSFLYD